MLTLVIFSYRMELGQPLPLTFLDLPKVGRFAPALFRATVAYFAMDVLIHYFCGGFLPTMAP